MRDKKLQKLANLRNKVGILKGKLKQYHKLFMEDGTIDKREQRQLNKMQNLIARIEQNIDKRESRLTKKEQDANKSNEVNEAKEKFDQSVDETTSEQSETSSEDTAGASGSAEDSASTKEITGSVGKKGDNKVEDVKIVQELFNKLGNNFKGSGKCGPKTIMAIRKYQRGLGFSKPDGRIDPGGRTWQALSGGTAVEDTATASNEGGSGDTSGGPMNKPRWISVAEGEKGVKETKGAQHNPRVLEYHATTGGFRDDETPWCASFVNWVMEKAGEKSVGGTGARAMNWASYGKKLDRPAYGSIGVISYGGGKGHVGFVVGKQGNSILLLGGNQGDMVKISTFGVNKFAAFVVPTNYEVPANAYSFSEAEGDYASGGGVNETR